MTSRSKVSPSNGKGTSLVSSSAQLLDRSTSEPINVNCSNVNNVVFHGNNNVEQDSHLDASSKGGGSTVTSVTFNTLQESVQEKDSTCDVKHPSSDKNMKNISIIPQRVDQTKINATSKKNLEVLQKLKSEKEHLLKEVQQLTDEKQFYKKKLEQHVGQNNTSYFDGEIIIHPSPDGKTHNTYNEKQTTTVKHKYEMKESNSKKPKTLTINTEDSIEGKSK